MRIRPLSTIFSSAQRLGLLQFRAHTARQMATMRVPHLIFGDNHTDSIEQEILADLAPTLKDMGYKRVMLEFSDSEGWSGIEQYIETEQRYYQDLVEEFKDQQLDINNPDHVEQYLHNYLDSEFRKLDNMYHEGEINGLQRLRLQDDVNISMESAKKTIAYKDDTEALKKFVATYKALGFKCRNIDTDSELTAACSDDEILQTMDTRSDAMAQAIIATEERQEPSITILGLRHLQHIQEKLIKKFGAHVAAEKYKFINISTPSREKTFFEEDVSSGKVNFPLGLHQIDSDLQTRIKEIIKQSEIHSASNESVINQPSNLAMRNS